MDSALLAMVAANYILTLQQSGCDHRVLNQRAIERAADLIRLAEATCAPATVKKEKAA